MFDWDITKTSKRLMNFQQESGIPNMDHSQLPMQNKIRLDTNAFKFLSKVFIMLQKELNSLPPGSIPIATVFASYTWRENICVHNPFHRTFHQGKI